MHIYIPKVTISYNFIVKSYTTGKSVVTLRFTFVSPYNEWQNN